MWKTQEMETLKWIQNKNKTCKIYRYTTTKTNKDFTSTKN